MNRIKSQLTGEILSFLPFNESMRCALLNKNLLKTIKLKYDISLESLQIFKQLTSAEIKLIASSELKNKNQYHLSAGLLIYCLSTIESQGELLIDTNECDIKLALCVLNK